MKVSPWNQHLLAWQEAGHSVHVPASKGARVSRGCASLIHFLLRCTRIKGLPSFKLCKRRRRETASDSSSVDRAAEDSIPCSVVDAGELSNLHLKSCLKKQSKGCRLSAVGVAKPNDHCTEVRKVHWSDSSGRQLAEIMAFKDSIMEGDEESSC